jgi:chloramphenicol 3-O-phosphotransferase
MSDAVLLIGSPGAGKSSVLEKLATLLEIDGTPHGWIESEAVGLGFPLLTAAAWMPMLEEVLTLQRRAGRELMLIAATPESEDELQRIRAAAGAHVIVVCLTAPAAVVAARVQEREPDSWPGKQWLVNHARELAETIPRFAGIDVAISTDRRTAADVAAEVRQVAIEHGVLTPVEGTQ